MRSIIGPYVRSSAHPGKIGQTPDKSVHLRLHGERAHEADALLHAAGNLRRPLVLGMRHLHEIVHGPGAALRAGLDARTLIALRDRGWWKAVTATTGLRRQAAGALGAGES
jgi:hypothetical protein